MQDNVWALLVILWDKGTEGMHEVTPNAEVKGLRASRKGAMLDSTALGGRGCFDYYGRWAMFWKPGGAPTLPATVVCREVGTGAPCP